MGIAFATAGTTSQALSTSAGLLTYVESGDQALWLYDGPSSTGPLISLTLSNASAPASIVEFTTPVQFKDGLFASVASTTSTVAYTAHII